MDDRKKMLTGSPSRDRFKQAHKELSGRFYACDLDFILVEKYPPHIAAILDFKLPGDKVTFAEVIAYNDLLGHYPIFIVTASDPENGPYEIEQYLGGDYRPFPPIVHLVHITTCKDLAEFGEWEAAIRKDLYKGTN